MTKFIAVDRRGTTWLTVCVGPLAIKLARGAKGRWCNCYEAKLWKRTTAKRRAMLCPILFAVPGDLALVMKRATPISEDEAHQLRENFGFPDWDYVPPDDECPFEPKASDWGHLSDGRLVALDYSPGYAM